MNEPKVASAPVDAERVVRELLDAFKSLKKKRAPHTCSSAGEPGVPPTTSNAFALRGAVSDIGEAKPEQIPEVESAENSEPPGFEAQSGEYGIIQGFCRSHGIVERFRVTPQELQSLSDASLLGSLTCKQDVLFMLRQIREATKPAEPQATVAPKQFRVMHPSGASSLKRAENHSSSQSENTMGESEANDRLPEDEKNKTQEFDTALKSLSGQVASQTERRERREYRASKLHWNTTGAKAAILISIVSLFLSVLTLGVLYKILGAYRRHTTIAATPVATPATITSKQGEINEETLSAVQAQAIAAKLASEAAKSQADSAKIQADAAALSASSALDMLRIAEGADVNVEAIYCSPRAAFSLDTTLTLRYRNSGRTRADNFESVFSFGIPAGLPSGEATVAASDVSADSVSAGASIPSGTTGTVGDVLSKNPGSVPPEQAFQKIVAGQLKFGIWGYVRYTDVLREKHQKNFEYVWDRNFPDACLFTEVSTSGH